MRISDWSSDVCSSDLAEAVISARKKLIEAAGLFGFHVRAGVPQGYEPDTSFVEAARARGVRVDIVRDAREAVAGADLVVTDTWVSMGQDHAHNKIAAMAPYQVDERLMTGAKRSEEHTSELQSLMPNSSAV